VTVDELTVTVTGEVDDAARVELAARLEPLLRRAEPIVVDLREAAFADDAGLHVLVAARRHLQEHGGSLVVLASASVHRALTHLAFDVLEAIATD
jgi:anti-anti-sigma factor